MSVQLVLYPQNYLGYLYSTLVSRNILADSQSFLSVLSTSVYTYTTTPNTVVDSFSAGANWKGFYIAGQTAPQNTNNTLILTGQNAPALNSGVYQKLTGLTVGQNYTVTIDISSVTASGVLTVGLPPRTDTCGGQFVSNNPVTAATTLTIQFVAQNAVEIFILQWKQAGAGVITIDSMSIEESTVISGPAGGATGGTFNADPIDGQVIVDLYEEEGIPLTLSVDDFKNVAEKVQSYSKDFNLPGTKRNNLIFDNIYEITRTIGNTQSFNPYIQTKAILKEDGFTIFEGFLRLIEIKDQEGELSYNVNLYSNAIALADILKGLTFSDLNFEELNHIYNSTNIANSNNGVLALSNPLPTDSFAGAAGATTTNVLRYPLCNWNGKVRRNPTSTQVTAIGANAEFPAISNEGIATFYRPFIKLKYIIQNIFKAAGFTYTSTFFDSAEFSNLYMDFNWGAGNQPTTLDEQVLIKYLNTPLNFATPSGSFKTMIFPNSSAPYNSSPLPSQINPATGILTADRDGLIVEVPQYIFTIINEVDTYSATIQLVKVENGTNVETIIDAISFTNVSAGTTSQFYFLGQHIINLNQNDTLFFRFRDDGGSNFTKQHFDTTSGISGVYYFIQGDAIAQAALLNKHRGKLKQWDFLKDIFTMFNLITLQDKTNPTNLIIDTYDDTFLNNPNSVTYDWTHKVDATTIQIEPLKLKRTITLKYKTDDKDYCARVFKDACFQYEYGSLERDGSTALQGSNQLTNLTGEEKIELKIFSSTVVKPIFQDLPEWIAPCIYGADEEGGEFKGIDNNPRILYNVTGDDNYQLQNMTFFMDAENGSGAFNHTTYQRFSHTSTIPSVSATTNGYNFGNTYGLIGIGPPPVNDLYNRFYQGYFNELYNPDTRIVKLSALLTPADVANFEFFDKVRIKNREYKIDYKPNALTKLELILIP